ncbi:MAG: hypothetical protein K0Q59_4382 [Paenibacillus sp.]|nr:hypothetical protein [Paenibacillus sp.]
MVFESVLFQNPIIHLLHLDIDRSDIIWFIERIMEKLSGVDSHLIYLYQNDSSIGINRMLLDRGGDIYLQKTYEKFKHFPYYINRGQTGPQLHVQFLQDYADIASQAISKCTLKTKSVENTSWNWHQDYISIMEFLGQTIHPDPELTSEELKKYVGVYRNEELGLTIQIQLIGDALIIFGNQRLKPRSAHAFYLDNISMSLRFSGEPSPKEVLIYEKDIVGNRNEHGTTFVKLP